MLNTVKFALDECTAANRRLKKVAGAQVRNTDDVASLLATAETWFHTHRPTLLRSVSETELADVDRAYKDVLSATSRKSAKTTYSKALYEAKHGLVKLRSVIVTLPPASTVRTEDTAPDFVPLVGNPEMLQILTRRWQECVRCVDAEAHLAGIVMMGGLLEALFVARANALIDKSGLVKSSAAPKDPKSGKTQNYQEWMLDSYIKVGRELGWITESAKDVADILKEFRNFVHPAKELRYQIELGKNDSSLFWEVTKTLARQLLASA